MDWLIQHWTIIATIVGAVISLASVIVKLTPNETDNKVLEWFIKIFEFLSLNTDPVNSRKK